MFLWQTVHNQSWLLLPFPLFKRPYSRQLLQTRTLHDLQKAPRFMIRPSSDRQRPHVRAGSWQAVAHIGFKTTPPAGTWWYGCMWRECCWLLCPELKYGWPWLGMTWPFGLKRPFFFNMANSVLSRLKREGKVYDYINRKYLDLM